MTRTRLILGLMLALAGIGCTPPVLAPSASRPAAPLHADTVRQRVIHPGILHRYLWDAAGPWAIHVLEVEPHACGVELRTIKANNRLQGRAPTSTLARQAAQQWARPALAAINADFFSFDPPGVPIGAQVSDGTILKGPAARPVFGVAVDGTPFIDVVQLRGEVRTGGGFAAPVVHVNTRPEGHALTLYTTHLGATTPIDTGVVELQLRVFRPAQAGDTARAVALEVDTLPTGVAIPADGAVLAARGLGAVFLRSLAAPGDTLVWWLHFDPAPGAVREMVGGFPRLLANGVPVHHHDPNVQPAFGAARHPRTAIGWRADGTLLLVTVDGRQPPYSEGMSLGELTEFFQRLGATEALNLDGGGSTTMVIADTVVNRPSDREGERANANALVVLGPTKETSNDPCRP